MKKGFVCSAFDLCHAGHLLMLEECSENCDWLMVGLHTDPTIDRPEKNKPVESVYQRYLRLDCNVSVDEIIPYETEEDLLVMLKSLDVDIRFLGEDYINKKQYTGKNLNIPTYFCKRYGYSSSGLRQKINEAKK
tara:strand:+ start:3695 stop:4096 length:402 start_codon:yes stop_codon:yes gene_type:complete